MHDLTPERLDRFPYSRYADARSIQRGRSYFKEGRVYDIELIGSSKAVCEVSGDTGDYTVEISADRKSGELDFDCDCPYAADGNFCKHMVAAALELSEFLKEQSEYDEDDDLEFFDEDEEDFTAGEKVIDERPPQPARSWRNQLDAVFYNLLPAAQPVGKAQVYAGVFLIIKEDYYYQGSFGYMPYLIRSRQWPALQDVAAADAQTVNTLLEADTDWYKYGEEVYSQPNPAGCLNLSPEAVNLLYVIAQNLRYFGAVTSISNYFALIAGLQIPTFVVSRSKRRVEQRVHILPKPVDLEVVFTRQGGNLVLKAGFVNEAFTPGEYKVERVAHNPPWLLMGDTLFTPRDPRPLPALSYFPVVIPESEADFFRQHYLRRVAELLPVKSDLIHWRDIQGPPVPRLYLYEERGGLLRAGLHYGYGEFEVPAAKSPAAVAVETVPDSWELARIHRQPEREQHFYQMLTDPNYRLKRAGSDQPYGTFELRARSHPVDFLMHAVPLLAQAGFEIYGEEKLKVGKVNRATPTVRVNLTSGFDWFDLKAVVEYGDQQVSLQEVRRALKRGEHYIKLADGSLGQIPEEWLEKYKHLWGLAEETSDGLRVRDYHLSLLDTLLDEQEAAKPADLLQRRERLRSFEQITSQELPAGFNGELRSYQKHGFDWLYFLREYNFGGILADDMGLGKTIQVLAFLQSLRERQAPQAASLLVVPKSLIANWQREANRFTPSLNFLEYVGNLRGKDTAAFDGYDVILTTYGTMLKDIEILRQYKFHYAILDESQAIKNPLAKSAKAARLLDAEHRLVMTGTPVENNTFELWSQFAYLNPGLLGNMDYFKREFASPIESNQDEQSAATLRKLVYPFILRRTKEQVAPELPPRSERVIYTGMDDAQKKLYNRTRDRYRAELMGLIEKQGIQDVRFRIIEGLLRLRQIAIHPALVERDYRGGSPKFEVLLQTLETLQAERHKALIFSQFVETLKLVRRELDLQKIPYAYLDGKTANRQAQVDLFQEDASVPFFLISLKAGGVGLNLTAADYVIHLDPWWNPAVEMQASDRAHRIGQDKPVFVYKIIARDTVEEKILQLQEKKRALVNSLITTETSFFKSLTSEDVKMLFE
jgi:non-specific serine/threonine protein kinase